ncbi:hypothetical protein [Thermosynechococcus vestitus]|uniref:Tsr0305 protein n=1 Tax=Thermosynechococcus vestitus (strain NIES-2133 / IAM M-273 / BP-1) TaxID=197221 RepID=Q8DM19_THEVB|nr:hypothetical protein [Thermosynechococcus vestitus]BAC07858.1 tsr0305 [Thermosynechococcus vestitus BP-1]BAY52011.1 hypothetical protein NIES2134_103880 [Thermostichus vulcanus NIES-2134]
MSQRSSGKWVAIVTGAISLLLGIGYLVLVQLLDWRGDWQPAPLGLLPLLLP